jgi:hypothetical protein
MEHHATHGTFINKGTITNGKRTEGQWKHWQMAQDQATNP